MHAVHPASLALGLLCLSACRLAHTEPTGQDTGGLSLGDSGDVLDTAAQIGSAVLAEALWGVEFDGGGMAQLNTTDWSVNGSAGSVLYAEAGREEWSVFLAHPSGPTAEIDLWTGKVLLDDSVLADDFAANPPQPTAWAATRAVYTGGAFVQITDSIWIENTPDGSTRWEQTFRDERSVHLLDAAQGVAISLDFRGMEVEKPTSSGLPYSLYRITDSNPAEIDGWLVREVLHERGRFVQAEHGLWHEVLVDDSVQPFAECAREAEAVTLCTEGSDVQLRLDLERGVISYSEGEHHESRDLYIITGAR